VGRRKILVAGAGIGGLTAAACLARRGFEVEIFEQAPQLGEVGAGIQTSANAVKVLYDLGLRDRLEQVAVKPKAYEFRRFDTGELLHYVPLNADDQHERKHGTPYYHLHRVDIHSILADRVRELAPSALHLDARVTDFQESENGVDLSLADGRTFRGDVLVGADGIKSVIRNKIVGDSQPRYTGQAAWRVTVPVERLPANLMDRVVTVFCGPKNHAVIYYLRSGKVLNFVGCHERDWEEESWTSRRPWEELRSDYAGWHPIVQSVIDAADRNECFRWALNSRPAVSQWSTAHATLLGDAVHPTLPYMAQGAVMAIEDSAVLARCLAGTPSVADALDRYQQARAERTARIVRESTEHGNLFHIVNAEEMRRAFREKDIARSRAEWLYCYDPLKVPLP